MTDLIIEYSRSDSMPVPDKPLIELTVSAFSWCLKLPCRNYDYPVGETTWGCLETTGEKGPVVLSLLAILLPQSASYVGETFLDPPEQPSSQLNTTE